MIRFPEMPISPARRRPLALAVALVLVGGLSGCEQEETADARAAEDLRQAARLQTAGDPARGYVQLAESASASDVNPGVQAIANLVTGDARRESAVMTLTGTGDAQALGLLAQEGTAIVLAEEINRLAGIVAMGAISRETQTLSLEGLQEVAGDLRSTAADMRDAQTWSPGNTDIELPGLVALQERSASITASIEEVTSEIESTKSTRDEALIAAGDAEQSADTLTGQEAVAAAQELADQRNRAAELSGEIAQLEGRLRRLEEERIRVQTQLTAMESSAESLENLARNLDETVTGAGGLEDRIESIDQQLGRVIEEAATPDGPVSIQALNQQLAQALSTAEELRSAALEDLAAAAQAYEQADRQATNARVTGAASALDRLVNQTMEGVAGSSEISRAITQRERANLFVNAAQVDAALLRLQTAATASQQAGRSIGNLNLGEPAASFSRNLERAAASLRDGLETVDMALGGARNAQQAAALGEKLRILRRMRDVRQLLASTAQGDTPAAEVTVELPSMQELETMMTEVFDTAASADISLPRTGRTAEPALPDDPASADDDQTGLTDDAASETDDAAAEMEADE